MTRPPLSLFASQFSKLPPSLDSHPPFFSPLPVFSFPWLPPSFSPLQVFSFPWLPPSFSVSLQVLPSFQPLLQVFLPLSFSLLLPFWLWPPFFSVFLPPFSLPLPLSFWPLLSSSLRSPEPPRPLVLAHLTQNE